jgi:DNA-binding MarR family transcriptional regulator
MQNGRGRSYTGQTGDLSRRLGELNMGVEPGAAPRIPIARKIVGLSLDKQILAYTNSVGRRGGAKDMQAMIDKIASECVAVRLRMLNRVITNVYDDALRSLDLKVSQMNILVAAAKMGTARPSEVCEHLHLDVSTLSRNVERMKARGWLEVVPDEDGRSQPFRLTPQGRKLLEKAVPAWSGAQQQVKKVLGAGLVEQLNQAVKRVSKSALTE